MTNTAKINEAIQSFSDWSFPWKFMENVVVDAKLGPFEKNLAQAVWAEAFNVKYWRSEELTKCIEQTEIGLARKYAWLSEQACKNLARAASYERS
jgi:hypothetical protein